MLAFYAFFIHVMILCMTCTAFRSPRDHRYRINFNILQNIFSLVGFSETGMGFSETGRPTSVANRQNQYTCKDFLLALAELSHGDE